MLPSVCYCKTVLAARFAPRRAVGLTGDAELPVGVRGSDSLSVSSCGPSAQGKSRPSLDWQLR